MQYHINEGSFQLPPDAQDRSVNMVILNAGPGGFTLVVTRDQLEEGEALDEIMQRQIRTLGLQVKQLKQQDSIAVVVGATQLQGLQVGITFKQNNATVHQLQTMVALADNKVLVFTLTSAAPLTPDQRVIAQQMLASFVPPPSITSPGAGA